jgi:Protein of unknown function (DUF998)
VTDPRYRCGYPASTGSTIITKLPMRPTSSPGALRGMCRRPADEALGPGGWVQAANFAVTGILVAAAAGLSRAVDPAAGTRAGPALIGAAGAALIGSALVPTDPVSGYPPGTPALPRAPSRAGPVHNLAAIAVFTGLPAAAAGASWRAFRTGQRRWGLYRAGTAITRPAAMALAGAGCSQSPRLVRLGGLFQRASIVTGLAWLTTLSARALQHAPTTASPDDQQPDPASRVRRVCVTARAGVPGCAGPDVGFRARFLGVSRETLGGPHPLLSARAHR